MAPVIGFIGLGIMGKPMAGNIRKAGFPVVVYDLLPAAVAELEALGASAAESPRALAEQVEIVVLCLPDSPDVETAVAGEDGVLAGIAPGKLIVDMSSISPVTARALAAQAAAQGVDMLDAPVSGGPMGAIQGTLSIMVGGNAEAFDRAMPVLQAMGKTILHMGEAGAGQVTKACNQAIIAVSIQAVAEAMLLAAKAGVDPAKVREALLGGHAFSKVLDYQGGRFLERDFTPGFKTRLQYKDLNVVMETARTYGAPMPAAALVHQFYNALMAQGHADADHTILLSLMEEMAGKKLKDEG